MTIVGRVLAMLLGLIGSAIALVVDLLYATIHRSVQIFADSSLDQTHGFIGFLLVLVGVAGSVLSLFAPTIATLLLLVAGIGLFFVIKGYAVLSILFFLVAAFLAYMDRSSRRRAA